MTTIIGIDPGSNITGYGVIQIEGNRQHYVASGCIRVKSKEIGSRLGEVHQGIREVVMTHRPDEAAIEQVFMHQNAAGAIKLGQARGVAIVAASMDGIPVAEYSARQIKQAVVGYGAAVKEQVQHMVKTLLNLSGKPQEDAADALAVALCHAYTSSTLKSFE